MRETQSPPNGKDLAPWLAVLIAVVFFATAALLYPWDRDRPAAVEAAAGPDLALPVLVRTAPKPVLYHGSESCEDCHSKKDYKLLWKDWTKGGHKDLACEICHGPAGDHVLPDVDPRPKMPVSLDTLAKPHELCMRCHSGRQDAVARQIDCEKHLAEFQIKKEEVEEYEEARQCLGCHKPHRPVKD